MDGNILDTPAEPANSMLKHHVKHTAYPCKEANGMVFTYMGPRERNNTQDACVTETMGAITDRTQEHLGISDTHVVAVRQFLLKAVRDLEQGSEPPGLVFHPEDNDFGDIWCINVSVPEETPVSEVMGRLRGVVPEASIRRPSL